MHRVAEKGGEWVGITMRRAKRTAKFSQLINYSLVGVVNYNYLINFNIIIISKNIYNLIRLNDIES